MASLSRYFSDNHGQDFNRQSIFGHSMGGHGALSLYLATNNQYRSASAFAPVSNPTKAPWGTKAFSNYLKGGVEEGTKWDSSHLLENAKGRQGVNILVDYVGSRVLGESQHLHPAG